MARCLQKTEHANFRKVLKLVVRYLEDGSADNDQFVAITSETFTEESARVLFAGVIKLLRCASRQVSLKPEFFKEDLQMLRLSPEVVNDLHAAAFKRKKQPRATSDSLLHVRLPQLTNLRWRVDVTISNSSLSRVLEPFLLMELTLSNGTVRSFEIPVSKFHELRYNVATVLKEMEDLEKRSILKLD